MIDNNNDGWDLLSEEEQVQFEKAKNFKSAREKVGFAFVEALEKSYKNWLKLKTPASKKTYLTWRLRLRLKFNHRLDILERLNKEADVGLYDEEVGPLYDDLGHTEVWTGKG